jgi:DNA-3-methyladenine glycosylase
MILSRSFFSRDTVQVAQDLLGCYLSHTTDAGTTVGKIVETEAYLGAADPAAHSFRGPTPRTQVMFGQPGTAYVYFIYGMHYCFNVVTGGAGRGEAVLIRALEPTQGLEVMQARRHMTAVKQLCSGPAKLVQAMGILRSHNGDDVTQGDLVFLSRETDPAITTTTRVGITQAAERPLRFYISDNEFISRK